MLLKVREMSSLQRPSSRDYRSVKCWFINHKPVEDEEWKYIRRKEDLVTLRAGRECAGFEGAIEYMIGSLDTFLQRFNCHLIQVSSPKTGLIMCSQKLQRLFLTKSLSEKTSDPDLRYYSPARVDTLVGIIITMIIFVLLVLPVVAMYELSGIGKRQSAFEAIGILIVSTLVFGMAMSVLTRARRHELFAACAAYCAVLVVFIGNFSVQAVQSVT
jgi:hypothetical protein